MDVECSEWSALDAMLAKRSNLEKIKQLLIEFHPCQLRKATTLQHLQKYWQTLHELDRFGFKLWRVWNHLNPNTMVSKFRFRGKVLCKVWIAYYLNVNFFT